jgi:hypothetical protein
MSPHGLESQQAASSVQICHRFQLLYNRNWSRALPGGARLGITARHLSPDRRSQGDDLRLRPIRQAMDRRPARGAAGNLPHLWRKHGLWRRFAGQAERGQRGSLLRADLLRIRSNPAGGASAGSRKRLLHSTLIHTLGRKTMAAVAERSHADILPDPPRAPDPVSVTMPLSVDPVQPAVTATPSNSSTGTLGVKMVDPEIFTPGHGGTYAPRSAPDVASSDCAAAWATIPANPSRRSQFSRPAPQFVNV